MTDKGKMRRRRETAVVLWLFCLDAASIAKPTFLPNKPRNCLLLPNNLYTSTAHDTELYAELDVPTNATLMQIQKSYRRLSRDWHPDKIAVRRRKLQWQQQQQQQQRQSSSRADDDLEEYARNKLQRISTAYEILGDDHSRLLYHRYGLRGSTEAALHLLTGRQATNGNPLEAPSEVSNEQSVLLRLMGYSASPQNHHHCSNLHRMHNIQNSLMQKLLPIVDGTITQELFIANLYHECSSLKSSPLGAQILRCVGRAYRIEGYRVLRQELSRGGTRDSWKPRAPEYTRHDTNGFDKAKHRLSNIAVDRYRDVKHLAQAALASTKLIHTERQMKRLDNERRRAEDERSNRRQKRHSEEIGKRRMIEGRKRHANIHSHGIGALPGEETSEDALGDFSLDLNDLDSHFMHDEDPDNDALEWELQHTQQQKIYQALHSMHQMEALWKLTKIELDRVVRESCRSLLSPAWDAFGPSNYGGWHNEHAQQDYQNIYGAGYESNFRQDGWVNPLGETVSNRVGRLRAAAALVLVGDIFVQCSKE